MVPIFKWAALHIYRLIMTTCTKHASEGPYIYGQNLGPIFGVCIYIHTGRNGMGLAPLYKQAVPVYNLHIPVYKQTLMFYKQTLPVYK